MDEEADPIPTTEEIFVQVPRAEHQEEIEHQPEEMNPNRDGIEGPLIAEPEANHGESVTPSNDAQIAPLQRLSFQPARPQGHSPCPSLLCNRTVLSLSYLTIGDDSFQRRIRLPGYPVKDEEKNLPLRGRMSLHSIH